MSLPGPNLDDRRFQDLVDEAKRAVQQHCPEWTDHNVSDPGVTLIETFAHMVDQLLYRLNRVPDRNHLAFLDLIGLRLHPPAAARAEVTCRLSAAQDQPVVVPAGTEVATERTTEDEPVVFSTDRELVILPCALLHLATGAADAAGGVGEVRGAGGEGRLTDRDVELAGAGGTACFSPVPRPGDVLAFGLSQAVPHCLVVLRLEFPVRGHGINPLYPPLVWEAWTAEGWVECEVEGDSTGGLNQSGDVQLHVPGGHTASVEARRRAGWLRCRVLPPLSGRPDYSASPELVTARAFTVGGTTSAVHGELVTAELLGTAEGVPGQCFPVARPPVAAGGGPLVLEVAGAPWREVEHFTDSGPEDPHFRLDRAAGEVRLGPAVREPDGTLRRYGAVPAKGAPVRLRAYRTGGGRRGNVARRTLTVLRSSVPYLARVENRAAATGGVDGERVADARQRGQLELRTRGRAVTAEDYEQLAREAAPEVGRVRCVGEERGPDAGGVRVLLVPRAEADPWTGQLDFGQLVCSDDLLARVTAHLDARRLLGARLLVEPPYYQGVTVVAEVQARPGHSRGVLQRLATAELHRYLDPLTGGPGGGGWPFGRPVVAGELFAVLQRLPGLELVERVRLYPADPRTRRRGEAADRVALAPHALVFSFEHQVRVS
ncbi:putative baseplate assembly protein [Kitasatospora albolonga]|uniref:putative baseplate assembly protein n=1 Tax=Kitasatospora albolonga TaxID=68173 RepID=UPI0035E8923C